MAYNETLAHRVRAVVSDRPGLSEKKMFGGLAFMLNGNMCCGIVKEELMVRVGPDQYEAALARPHARRMDFTGRPMKGMVYVAEPGFAADETLAEWVAMGADFAGSLPAKS
jgi:hypothetical protein